MATDDQPLLDALMGKVDGSLVDQVDAALDVAWRLSAGMNLTLPASGAAPGPYRPKGTVLDLAVDQATARWGKAPKARTLVEKAALLEALVVGIAANRPGTGTPTPSAPPTSGSGGSGNSKPAPAPGWRTLPAPTSKLSEGDTSSYQHTAPRWTDKGMRIDMPARGEDGRQTNADKGADYQRCEITAAGQGGIRGGTRAFRFVYDLDDAFPVGAKDWQVLAQWKGDGTGSPPLSLEVRDGQWMLTWHQLPTTPVGKPVAIGPARPGRNDVIVAATFSTSRDGSPVSAWLNGTRTVDAAKVAPTLYSGKATRLKVGLYRSASIGKAAGLTLAGFAAGDTLAAVTG